MTSVRTALQKALASMLSDPIEGAPGEVVVAPQGLEEAARVLSLASEHHLPVLVWGGGSHQGIGGRVDPAIVLSTARLDQITDWQPDDLTVVVEAGVEIAAVESRLAERGQTAVLPEKPGEATVGGVVATGVSGWGRRRYGPTRDRMLEVELVTGDGRIVRGGGRVVKNVTGYDVPRLAAGSLGGLGLIGRVCLKLWPIPSASATVTLDGPLDDYGYRPLAVIEEQGSTRVFVSGTPAEVEARVAELGGWASEGLAWPEPFDHPVRLSLRIAPRLLREAVSRLAADWEYRALPGVGEVEIGLDSLPLEDAGELRDWAEQRGGQLVVVAAPEDSYGEFDPWGAPPGGLELQRRIVARFDPARVVNPGRLPGGL